MSAIYRSSEIYHLRIAGTLPHTSLARCNTKNSHNWQKYRQEIFRRGQKLNLRTGEFEPLTGQPCKRCWQLLDS